MRNMPLPQLQQPHIATGSEEQSQKAWVRWHSDIFKGGQLQLKPEWL